MLRYFSLEQITRPTCLHSVANHTYCKYQRVLHNYLICVFQLHCESRYILTSQGLAYFIICIIIVFILHANVLCGFILLLFHHYKTDYAPETNKGFIDCLIVLHISHKLSYKDFKNTIKPPNLFVALHRELKVNVNRVT